MSTYRQRLHEAAAPLLRVETGTADSFAAWVAYMRTVEELVGEGHDRDQVMRDTIHEVEIIRLIVAAASSS